MCATRRHGENAGVNNVSPHVPILVSSVAIQIMIKIYVMIRTTITLFIISPTSRGPILTLRLTNVSQYPSETF